MLILYDTYESGLEPDLSIQLPEEIEEDFTDTQLQAAIDFLLGEEILDMPPSSDES